MRIPPTTYSLCSLRWGSPAQFDEKLEEFDEKLEEFDEKLEDNGFVIPYTYRVLQAVNTSDEEAFLEDYKKYSNSVMLTGRKDLPRYTTPLYDKLFPDDISTIENWLLNWKANKSCVSFEELMHEWKLYDEKALWTDAERQLLQDLLNSFELDASNAKKSELATSIMCQVLNLISDRHWTCEKKIYDWKLQYVWYDQTTLSQECNEKVLCLEKVLERISAEYAKQSYLFDIIDCVTNTQVGTFRSSDYDMETIRIDVSLAFNVSPDSLDVQFLDLQ